ncbi:MAG: hypothetical protein OEW12_05620 [Deltaproteobacteria bacterium]|nr:hypothetical protein [Deltaproteobacteria bacterium]
MATPPFKSVFKGITVVLLLAACGGNNSSSVDNLSISMTPISPGTTLNYSFSEQKNPASPSGYDPEVSATTEMVTYNNAGAPIGTYPSTVIHARSGYANGVWAFQTTLAFSGNKPGIYSGIAPNLCKITIQAPNVDISHQYGGTCIINIDQMGKVGDELKGNIPPGLASPPTITQMPSGAMFNINNLNFSLLQNP